MLVNCLQFSMFSVMFFSMFFSVRRIQCVQYLKYKTHEEGRLWLAMCRLTHMMQSYFLWAHAGLRCRADVTVSGEVPSHEYTTFARRSITFTMWWSALVPPESCMVFMKNKRSFVNWGGVISEYACVCDEGFLCEVGETKWARAVL